MQLNGLVGVIADVERAFKALQLDIFETTVLLEWWSRSRRRQRQKGQVLLGSGGLAGSGRNGATARPVTDIHGFLLGGCQQTKDKRPLGLRLLV